MRSRSPSALLLAVLALLVVAAPVAGTVTQQGLAPEGTAIEFQIQADGDARVSVVTRFAPDSANDSRAFDRLSERFQRGERTGYTAVPFERAAERASGATGREMTVENVTYDAASLEDGTVGELRLRLTWTNFATSEGDRIVVRSAFNTTNGTWLPTLREGQELVVRPPAGYTIESAPGGPRLRDQALVWAGPMTFEPGEVFVTYDRQQSPTTTSPSDPTSSVTGTPDDPVGQDLGAMVGGLLVLLAVLALAGYAVTRRDEGSGDASTATGGGAAGGAGAAAGAPDGEDSSDPDAGADDTDEGSEDGIDPELLSDEERVERLLRKNGGRMKQATIVTETGWSNAKVSQLLSSMDDAGQVEKLRIGRENLISLPDEE